MGFSAREDIIATILKKLYRIRKIGSSHTPIENLQRGFPIDLRGEVKKIAKELIKTGLLLASKHNYGIGISLNNQRILEIENIIKKFYPEFI